MTKLQNWSPEKVKAALDAQEIVLIDVRTPQEYMFEHIEGALLMPLAFFRPQHLPSQEGKRIVFHCGSGMRSARVSELSAQAGVVPIAHMEGGLAAWKEQNLPYTGTNMATGAPESRP